MKPPVLWVVEVTVDGEGTHPDAAGMFFRTKKAAKERADRMRGFRFPEVKYRVVPYVRRDEK